MMSKDGNSGRWVTPERRTEEVFDESGHAP
jgi:hypothetical protein